MDTEKHVNYYEVLGIKKNAQDSDIKQSYRKLAKQWHPDKNPKNKEESEKMFKTISEAYEILADPQKRQIYDEHGINGLKQTSGGEDPFDGMNPFDLFKNMFGGQEDGIPDCIEYMETDLPSLYTGSSVTKKIERRTFCDKCSGTGAKGGVAAPCKKCKGKGAVMMMIGPGMLTEAKCRSCDGLGIDEAIERCKKCKGQKFYKEKVELQVNIPKGAYHKFPVIIEEQGNQIPPDEINNAGKTRSDAVFLIVEAQHDVFKRGVVIPEKRCIDYSDLSTEITISFVDSLTGFSTVLTHLDNEKLVIESAKMCRHGDTFVVMGGGMPKLNDSDEKHGDLFVRIVVQHPEEAGLSDETKKQLIKALTGKSKLAKVSDKNNSVELVPLEKYIANIKIQADSDSLKEEYKYRNVKHDSDSDGDDNENVHTHRGQRMRGLPPQITQQCAQQ